VAQTNLEIELRCNACDSVLIINTIRTDKNGAFAYVEACSKCSAQQKMQRTICPACGRALIDGLCGNDFCAKFVPLI